MTAPGADAAPPALARLWDAHRDAAFPAQMRGREIAGHDMGLPDATLAGCLSSALCGPLDPQRTATPAACAAAPDAPLPGIDTPDDREYRVRPRTMAALVLHPARSRRSSFTRRRT